MFFVEQVLFEYAKDRPIIFSSFQPDAAVLMRKLQSTYPVSSLLFVLKIAGLNGFNRVQFYAIPGLLTISLVNELRDEVAP